MSSGTPETSKRSGGGPKGAETTVDQRQIKEERGKSELCNVKRRLGKTKARLGGEIRPRNTRVRAENGEDNPMYLKKEKKPPEAARQPQKPEREVRLAEGRARNTPFRSLYSVRGTRKVKR